MNRPRPRGEFHQGTRLTAGWAMGSLKKPQLGIPSLATAVHSARTFTGQVTHASSRRSRVDSQLWQIAYPESVRRFPFEASATGQLHPYRHHSLPISILSSPLACTGPADRAHNHREQPFGRARRLHIGNRSRNPRFEMSAPVSSGVHRSPSCSGACSTGLRDGKHLNATSGEATSPQAVCAGNRPQSAKPYGHRSRWHGR